MSIVGRIKNGIFKRKRVSVILFCVVFVFTTVMATSLAIVQMADRIHANFKKSSAATATLKLDEKQLFLDGKRDDESLQITESLVQEIGQLPEVDYYDHQYQQQWSYSGMSNQLMTDAVQLGSVYSASRSSGNGVDLPVYYNTGSINFIGVDADRFTDAQEGFVKSDKGSFFSAEQIANGEMVAYVPTYYAQIHQLSVGDYITVPLFAYSYTYTGDPNVLPVNTLADQSIQLRIVGTFTLTDANEVFPISSSLIDRFTETQKTMMNANDGLNPLLMQFYVPNKTLETMNTLYQTKISLPALTELKNQFTLRDPDQLNDFIAQAKVLITSPYISLVTSNDRYQSIMAPIQLIAVVSKYILWLSISGCVCVLACMVLYFVKQRRAEIGLYAAMGERPWKIVTQIFLEFTLVALLSLSLASVAGKNLSAILNQQLIAQQINTIDEKKIVQVTASNSSLKDELRNEFTLRFDGGYYATLFAAGLLTITLASFLPLIYVVRLRPKEILL